MEDEYSKYLKGGIKAHDLMPEKLYYKMKEEKGWMHADCQREALKIMSVGWRAWRAPLFGSYEDFTTEEQEREFEEISNAEYCCEHAKSAAQEKYIKGLR